MVFRVGGAVFRRFSLASTEVNRRADIDLDGDTLCALLNLITGRPLEPMNAKPLVRVLNALTDYSIPGDYRATLLAHADATAPYICPPCLASSSDVADVFHLAARLTSNVLVKSAMNATLNGFWGDLSVVRRWSAADKAKIGYALYDALVQLYGNPPSPGLLRKRKNWLSGNIHELDAEWHLGKGKRVRLEDTFFDSADREEQ